MRPSFGAQGKVSAVLQPGWHAAARGDARAGAELRRGTKPYITLCCCPLHACRFGCRPDELTGRAAEGTGLSDALLGML